MPDSSPYLSLVVAARNDDHGGRLLHRMQAFVNGWIGQCKRHGLSSELIIVEWNPPVDRAPLSEAIRWPRETIPCEVRIIQVPPEIHAQYRHASNLPLYQMIAKNAGIRRSRGHFVLASNIDIIFSDELMRYLAAKNLSEGRFYRIDRQDVMADVPAEATLDEVLAYCQTHLLRVNSREGTFQLTSNGRYRHRPFMLWRKVQGVIGRIAQGGPTVTVTLPVPSSLRRGAAFYVQRGGISGMLSNFGQRVFGNLSPATAKRQQTLEGMRESAAASGRKTVFFEELHTNACGDFTLMAREHWTNLRGYAELDMYSFNIDALLCYAAQYSGVREKLLRDPMRIFHIEHGQGSGWTPEGQNQLFERLQDRGIPWLDTAELMGFAADMQRLGSPIILNVENWGLLHHQLPEIKIPLSSPS